MSAALNSESRPRGRHLEQINCVGYPYYGVELRCRGWVGVEALEMSWSRPLKETPPKEQDATQATQEGNSAELLQVELIELAAASARCS